jgi:hypothetical protein
MKDAVVRARIDPGLEAQARVVLKANDLEISNAFRLLYGGSYAEAACLLRCATPMCA